MNRILFYQELKDETRLIIPTLEYNEQKYNEQKIYWITENSEETKNIERWSIEKRGREELKN